MSLDTRKKMTVIYEFMKIQMIRTEIIMTPGKEQILMVLNIILTG